VLYYSGSEKGLNKRRQVKWATDRGKGGGKKKDLGNRGAAEYLQLRHRVDLRKEGLCWGRGGGRGGEKKKKWGGGQKKTHHPKLK